MKGLLEALPGAILPLFVTDSVIHAQEPKSRAHELELAGLAKSETSLDC
jgi:hypothetical protein